MTSSAPRITRWLFFSIVLLFPVLDLLTAYLYHLSGSTAVGITRYYRDGVCLLLAILGFCSRHLPYQIRLAAGCYIGLIGIYALASLIFAQLPLSLIIRSLGTLIIPVSLTLASFAVIRNAHDLRVLMHILIAYAVASALFGLWEVQHTSFWTDTVALGNYMMDIKSITSGFQPDVLLPWNFIGFNGARRAAGLLAAPLAEGFFLVVIGLVAFAYLRARSLLMASLIALLCFYGAEMSATRGALIAAALAAMLYCLWPNPHAKTRATNLLVAALLVLTALPALTYHFLYTVTLEDHSTIGHLNALHENIDHIAEVVLVGAGVGAAGAQASAVQLAIEGGGEGAFFSIAYQLGLPGAAMFLWFLWRLFQETYAMRLREGTNGEIARALAFLFVGVVASMFTSEHILTFSGMGAFWFLIGGFLGYARRLPDKTPQNPPIAPTE